MNWLNSLITKKKKTNTVSKDIPSDLWIKCPSCTVLLFKKDVVNNHEICTNCDYHFFFPVKQRLDYLFDNAQYLNIALPDGLNDPLHFVDKEKYSDKLKKYRQKTGYQDALITGFGQINHILCVVSVMNFQFLGGSMGTAVGAGIVKSIEVAIEKQVPFIICTSSGGARMQEGMHSLMQMPKTVVAIEKLKEHSLPYIVVLTNPTTGGVTASFAMLGDIHIAESNATIGFAGVRVIEKIIRKKLPEGFQTAEYLLEHGMVDIVVHRKMLKEQLGKILNILVNNA